MYDIAFLDQLAANARPARVRQSLEGWLLRASDGVTRRANSVLTNAPIPEYGQWLEEIEAFYGRQGLPSRYQLSDASPPELDGLLEARGYKSVSNTLVMVGTVQDVLERGASGSECSVTIEEQVTDNWLAAFMDAEGFPARHGPIYGQMFSSIGPHVAYAMAWMGDSSAGVGMSVAERGWAGLFSIVTFAEYRRRGIGTSVMRALAMWARNVGCEQLYLQVVASNEAAVALYHRLGFMELYSYHYRETG